MDPFETELLVTKLANVKAWEDGTLYAVLPGPGEYVHPDGTPMVTELLPDGTVITRDLPEPGHFLSISIGAPTDGLKKGLEAEQ